MTTEERATLKKIRADVDKLAVLVDQQSRLVTLRVTLHLTADSIATPNQAAAALIGIAATLRTEGFGQPCADGTCTRDVKDADGNKVGYFKAYRGEGVC